MEASKRKEVKRCLFFAGVAPAQGTSVTLYNNFLPPPTVMPCPSLAWQYSLGCNESTRWELSNVVSDCTHKLSLSSVLNSGWGSCIPCGNGSFVRVTPCLLVFFFFIGVWKINVLLAGMYPLFFCADLAIGTVVYVLYFSRICSLNKRCCDLKRVTSPFWLICICFRSRCVLLFSYMMFWHISSCAVLEIEGFICSLLLFAINFTS